MQFATSTSHKCEAAELRCANSRETSPFPPPPVDTNHIISQLYTPSLISGKNNVCRPQDPAINTKVGPCLSALLLLLGEKEAEGVERERARERERERGGEREAEGERERETAISFVDPSHSAADRGCQHMRRVCR